MITAVLELVPYLGPTLAAIPPVLFAATVSLDTALLVLMVYVAIQQLEGHLLVPLIMARAVQLHPVVVAFGVVILGALFGLLGVLLAVPLLAALGVLLEELRVRPLERTAPARVDGSRSEAPAQPVAEVRD